MPRTLQDLWQLVVDELPPLPAEPPPAAPPALVLLNQVDRLLRRYVWFPTVHHSRALALWVLHTWAFDPASATPYMALISPEKRSGKTRALEVLEMICRESLRAASISAAGVFQAVEKWTPTLLIDEVDSYFTARSEQAEALRGILNAGNRRGGYVVRGTQEGEPRRFAAYCPKALSGINSHWPDTVVDRSILLEMRRKRAGQDVEDFFPSEIEATVTQLKTDLANWAAGAADELAEWRRAERVPGLSDRQQEGWDPLLAIADHAGEPWASAAREAAKELTATTAHIADESHGQQLLAALAQMFEKEAALLSKDICDTLNKDEELPFGAMRRGEGMDPRMLASLLRPYNIRPQDVWVNRASKKGYNAEAFDDAWARYAPPGADEPRGDLADDETVREASARDFWPQERVLADLADIAQDRGGFPDACSHESHRETDWRLKMRDGNEYPWHCGTCHPPAFGLDIELRHAVQSKEKS
jgi:hypothetical protein